jgi:CBS domain-containing protein
MQIKDTMTRKPITVLLEDSIADAAAKLSISKLHVLPVVNEHNQLLGLLLERDLIQAIQQAHSSSSDVPLHLLAQFVLPDLKVRDLMQPPTTSLRANLPIKEAARKMLEHGVYGLPIVDDKDHLLGVFTVTNLMKAVVRGDLMILWP